MCNVLCALRFSSVLCLIGRGYTSHPPHRSLPAKKPQRNQEAISRPTLYRRCTCGKAAEPCFSVPRATPSHSHKRSTTGATPGPTCVGSYTIRAEASFFFGSGPAVAKYTEHTSCAFYDLLELLYFLITFRKYLPRSVFVREPPCDRASARRCFMSASTS